MKIKEDFCSVEITELLKAKGADLETWALLPKHNPDGTSQMVEVPTHQAAMKWLREEKYIIIFILPCNDDLGDFSYYYDIATWDEDEGVYQMNHASQWFHVYEKAVETAIKYALENLI